MKHRPFVFCPLVQADDSPGRRCIENKLCTWWIKTPRTKGKPAKGKAAGYCAIAAISKAQAVSLTIATNLVARMIQTKDSSFIDPLSILEPSITHITTSHRHVKIFKKRKRSSRKTKE